MQIQEHTTLQTLEMPDGMLAIQSLDGNERAFERLVERYRPAYRPRRLRRRWIVPHDRRHRRHARHVHGHRPRRLIEVHAAIRRSAIVLHLEREARI